MSLQVVVGDEPEPSDEVVQVAFRMPSGERVLRRFRLHDTVQLLHAFVQQQLQTKQQVQLALQFPRKVSWQGA